MPRGRQFGSRYPGSPADTAVYDFLPEPALDEVANLSDFAGMLAFDKWTCNTNGRQAIFFRPVTQTRYGAQMIDNGFCFNAGEWNFPDAPLRGIYMSHRVYARSPASIPSSPGYRGSEPDRRGGY